MISLFLIVVIINYLHN